MSSTCSTDIVASELGTWLTLSQRDSNDFPFQFQIIRVAFIASEVNKVKIVRTLCS